jgi:hypothetical protein
MRGLRTMIERGDERIEDYESEEMRGLRTMSEEMRGLRNREEMRGLRTMRARR